MLTFRQIAASQALMLALVCVSGCSRLATGGWETPGGGVNPVLVTPNPLPVPLYPRELVMDEVSDEIEDYFRIIKEQRIRLADNILIEGFIDTEPTIGSTWLEPWKKDSTRGFELAHATLQTVRRWARVRVIPTADQYLIDVRVYKELEDLDQPLQSPVSGHSLRHDNSLDYDREFRDSLQPNRGWIPMGRDYSLEQTILENLKARFERARANGATCVR